MINFTFLQGLHYITNLGLALLMIFDLGFRQRGASQLGIDIVYLIVTILLLVVTVARNRLERPDEKRDRFTVILLVILLAITFLTALAGFLDHEPLRILFGQLKWVLITGLLLYLIFVLSKAVRLLYSGFLNPAALFAGTFALLILVGSFLLSLPQATVNGIGFIDALFTATSAVCVTGLVVVDTGKDYTIFGQSVILLLIQLGGLGVMTITSFFTFFFAQGRTFQEGIYIKDILGTEHIGNVLGLAAQVVSFTLAVELVGAVFIYFDLDAHQPDMRFGNQVFFALFHSVSAFCNAGFSTLSNGLFESGFRYDYSLHWTIALLLIVGGLGYAIIYNYFLYFRGLLSRQLQRLRGSRPHALPPRIITLNTKIVLVTTLILIAVGTIFMFFVEYGNTLAEHPSLYGKVTTAFFTAVTPRTAGFNSVNFADLTTPSILIVFLLMWIGASPGSTGGGIKTSTFAIASLNILAIARGHTRLEIGRREVSRYSIERAFAIISISLIVIGFSVFFVSVFEPGLDLLPLAFECFSAYSTVGLSLGITGGLSDGSKIVLMLTMFIGRIGAINLLIGMVRQVTTRHYQYPKENILIN